MYTAPCYIHIFPKRVRECHVCAQALEETVERQKTIVATRYRMTAAARATPRTRTETPWRRPQKVSAG